MRATLKATMARSLLATALATAAAAQAQTVAIYSRQDSAAVERAASLVRAFDPVLIDRQLKPSTPWRRAMAKAILEAHTVLVFWSAHAAKSPEVGAEWRLALVGCGRVIPVLLDATPLPAELGALQAIDWRHTP